MKYPVYNIEGEKVKEIDLNDSIFNIDVKPEVIHEVVVAQMANNRRPVAHTKTRSEVKGGGRKPWRQKGTGRARHGSIRSPLWVGGGVVFGPRNDRNFSKKINKKMRKKAILMALSDRFSESNAIIVESLNIETPKTKEAVSIFSKFFNKIFGSKDKKDINSIGYKFLIITPNTNQNLILALRNIPKVKVIRADSLNTKDLVDYPKLIILEDSIKVIEKIYQVNK